METLIDEIMAATGPVPDAKKHRHYLESLGQADLEERLKTLLASNERKPSPTWWSKKRPLEATL